MKLFFKRLIDFLNKGWVNFLAGDLILFISILIFFQFATKNSLASFCQHISKQNPDPCGRDFCFGEAVSL